MYDQMSKSALVSYADSNVTVFTAADVAQQMLLFRDLA